MLKDFSSGNRWSKSMTNGGKLAPQSAHGRFFASWINFRISARRRPFLALANERYRAAFAAYALSGTSGDSRGNRIAIRRLSPRFSRRPRVVAKHRSGDKTSFSKATVRY